MRSPPEAILLLLGAALSLNPQTPPVIRVDARLVEVGVSVVDAHGNHVRGLTVENFALLDQDQPRNIVSFAPLDPPSTGPPPAAPPSADKDGVWTNRRFAALPPTPPLTVLLLDRLNTAAQDQTAAQAALRRFLAQSPPAAGMALYLLSDRLYRLIDLTYDRQAVLAAADRFLPAENNVHTLSDLPPSRTGLPIDWMENFVRSRVNAYYMPQRRVRPTENALALLAARLSRIPGRKNLIWISGGCPLPTWSAARLSAASVAVYPIDAHGVTDVDLRMEDHQSPFSPVFVGMGGEYHDPHEASLFPPDPGFLFKVAPLAAATGGEALTGSNDLASQLRRAVADGRGDYLLAFRPDASHWDGKLHALRVTVNRPGLRVRARTGYLAVDILPDAQEQLRMALEDPAESAALPIDVYATRLSASAIATRVQAPCTAVAFEQAQGNWVARLKLVFVQLDAAGKSLGDSEQSLNFSLPAAAYEEARHNGLRLTTPVAIHEGAARLRIFLEDVSTAAIGSLTISL